MLAAISSTGYEIVKTLHVLTAIIGFGTLALQGVAARAALDNKGPAGGLVARTSTKISSIAEVAILLVPVFGIALVFMSGDVYRFEQPWLSASFVLYLIGLGLGLGVIRPAAKRFDAAVGDPAQAEEAERLGKTLAIVSGIANLLWVVVLFLMVLKPGL